MIPDNELMCWACVVSLGAENRALFLGVTFRCSHRLFDLRLIDRNERDLYLQYPVKKTAKEYGYDTTLYEPGNENLVIGNFGEKARRLFDEEKISEGHYIELLHKIGINDSED